MHPAGNGPTTTDNDQLNHYGSTVFPHPSSPDNLHLCFCTEQQKPTVDQPDEPTPAEHPAAMDTPCPSSPQLTLSIAARIPSVPCHPSATTGSIDRRLLPRTQGPAQSVRTHSSSHPATPSPAQLLHHVQKHQFLSTLCITVSSILLPYPPQRNPSVARSSIAPWTSYPVTTPLSA